MFTKKSNIIFLSLIILFFSSCISPYVGRTVKMDHPSVCKCESFPKTCRDSSQHFEITYNIKKLSGTNTFFVEGTAKYKGSATWENYSGLYFTLLLVKDGIITETITATGGRGNLDDSIIFSREFTTKEMFDAVLITYKMNVMG